MSRSCKYFLCLFLLSLAPLSSFYPSEYQRDRTHAPREDIQIYNENYYPTYNPYYGYQPILTPAEVFPDDAEANYLFEKMHE